MIQVAGEWWGTAAEIADQIGHGVTAATVRRWAERDDLTAVRTVDRAGRRQVRYLLGEAVVIERAKRHAHRGRQRARRTTNGLP
ncbi:hypothetical protein [Actinoplanes aureus]|uniref:Uncharacterized protein n=1 Tax=Actinoplanes aureus TaxID=2792083 RepID=A0A931C4Z6_9ACTN|nr:hypothetical protein [Actinoplanes aureus]MBG0560707.1 hypothetical protein [Actinoplanes aureus]